MSRSKSRVITGGLIRTAAIVGSGLAAGAVALSAHFARRILTPASSWDERVLVWAVEESNTSPTGQRVWINGPDVDLDGNYSFIWANGTGHARLGHVVDSVRDGDVLRVARDVIAIDSGELAAGAQGRITGWWFTGPEGLGGEVETVSIPVDSGHTWAWLIRPVPGTEQPGRWAVHVHGRGVLPEETLRGVAPLARAGITSLVMAYRNDPGAPRGVNGRYGLGLAEQRDVDDAISWAVSQGADRVTLMGWSMGSSAVMRSANYGPVRDTVDGIVLDSPALDWPAILRRQADLAGLPSPFVKIASGLMQHGWVHGAVPGESGTDLEALTVEALAAGLQVPTLIHASPEDTFVPWEGALAFAQLHPNLVVVRQTRGEHVKLWNVDPRGWEESTESFVRALRDPHLNSRD